MAILYNLCRVLTATTGTGSIALGAAVSGHLTFAQAGVPDGVNVSYAILEGANAEVGRGVYSQSGQTLTRSVLKSTNADSLISLNGAAQVLITALAEDFNHIIIQQTGPTTSQTGPYIFNEIDINDDTPVTGDTRTMGLYMQYNTGGTHGLGGKYGAFFNMRHNVNSATGGDHIAFATQMYSTAADTSGGELYAGSIATVLDGGSATALNGFEVDISMKNASTATRRMGMRVVNDVGTQKATSQDAAYAILSKTSGGEFKTGFLLSKFFGQSPLSTTGDWFGLDAAQTIANVFNCSSLTVTGNIFNFPGLLIKGTGAASFGGASPNTGVMGTFSDNVSAIPPPDAGTMLQIAKADGNPCGAVLDAFGTGAFTAYGQLAFRRANGTAASKSALQSGDLIGLFGGEGYGASAYSSSPKAQLRFLADENWSNSVQGASIRFLTTATGGTTTAEMMALTGAAALFTGVGTTASAANAFLNSAAGNSLLRSTSSLAYKKDVEPLDPKIAAATISALKPIWYRSIAAEDRKDWSWYGLGAEDVAKIDPRLVHWGYQDDAYDTLICDDEESPDYGVARRVLKHGAKKVPDGVMYERLVCHLILVVQDLMGRLKM